MRSAALLIAAVAMLLAVAAIIVSIADARPAAATSGQIQVTAKNLSRTYRSVGESGRTSDTSEQIWSLRNRTGKAIGRLLLGCRWVGPAARLCTGVVRMPLGTISVTGASETSFAGELAVVGGTAHYEGVGGATRFVAIGRDRMVLVIDLA